MHSRRLQQIAHSLENGAVIAYPTETVWGLGCLPDDNLALAHLAQIKQRNIQKGFILIASSIEICLPFIDPDYHQLAKEKVLLNKQKPTTWLVPKAKNISPLLTGQFQTIAIRISPHPFVKALCPLINMPLVSTSANLSTRPSLNSGLLIQKHLGKKLDHIINGYPHKSRGTASTIIDLVSNKVIRA